MPVPRLLAAVVDSPESPDLAVHHLLVASQTASQCRAEISFSNLSCKLGFIESRLKTGVNAIESSLPNADACTLLCQLETNMVHDTRLYRQESHG
jgi:hypothetical protein